MDALHFVCFSRNDPFRNGFAPISKLVDLLSKHHSWQNVRATIWPETDLDSSVQYTNFDAKWYELKNARSRKRFDEFFVPPPEKLGSIDIVNYWLGAKDGQTDFEWQFNVGYQQTRKWPDVAGSWLMPYDAMCTVEVRCNEALVRLDNAERMRYCRDILKAIVEVMDGYFAFITCEDLQDTWGGDFYRKALFDPCTNIRREAMHYWESLPIDERRITVPAIFWGNYYSGELLEAIQAKCPDFINQIVNWKITEPKILGPRPSPHIAEPMGSGFFWTLAEDPLFDSRNKKIIGPWYVALGTGYHGRLIALNMFARRLLAKSGLHI